MGRRYEIQNIEVSKIKSSESESVSKKTKIFYNDFTRGSIFTGMVRGT